MLVVVVFLTSYMSYFQEGQTEKVMSSFKVSLSHCPPSPAPITANSVT